MPQPDALAHANIDCWRLRVVVLEHMRTEHPASGTRHISGRWLRPHRRADTINHADTNGQAMPQRVKDDQLAPMIR